MAETGAAATEKTRSAASAVFVALSFILLALPFVGMPFFSHAAEAEKRDADPFPSIVDNGICNLQFFSELDGWYNDNFAFRTQLVDANASLREALFMESSVDNVVVGADGWLYYQGTMGDYRRSSQMSDRALDNAAYNIALMQENAQRLGLDFIFTIAPNKNTLYPGHMPYFEVAGEGPSNAERIEPLLDAYGVNYLNLFEVLAGQDGELYLHGDSHWTNEGALVAACALADALDHDLGTYEEDAPAVDAHIGDLAEMLHPLSANAEEQPLWPQSLEFSYTNDAADVEDGSIETASERPDARGALMCYRDSFGNALLPYLASSYGVATFSKMVPYDMHPALLAGFDDVVVERAERHLAFFSTTPPYMPAPQRSIDGHISSEQTATTCFAEQNGPYLMVEGTLDERFVEDGSTICVALISNGHMGVFEAFHVSAETDGTADADGAVQADARIVGDYGYRAFVAASQVPSGSDREVAIIVCNQSGNTSLYREKLVIGGQG